MIPFDTHSTASLPPSAILKKNQVFFHKNPSFFFKKKFERFEKPYHFSHILRRNCYNVVIKKFHGESRRTQDSSHIEHFQLAKKVKRSISAFSVDDLPSILKIWAENSKKKALEKLSS